MIKIVKGIPIVSGTPVNGFRVADNGIDIIIDPNLIQTISARQIERGDLIRRLIERERAYYFIKPHQSPLETKQYAEAIEYRTTKDYISITNTKLSSHEAEGIVYERINKTLVTRIRAHFIRNSH